MRIREPWKTLILDVVVDEGAAVLEHYIDREDETLLVTVNVLLVINLALDRSRSCCLTTPPRGWGPPFMGLDKSIRLTRAREGSCPVKVFASCAAPCPT